MTTIDSLNEAQIDQIIYFLERCIDDDEVVTLSGQTWEPSDLLDLFNHKSFDDYDLSEDELEELLKLASYE